MNNGDPIAYFLTWTLYGTHLQGDVRGWRRRRKGEQLPQPRLAQWRRERLQYDVLLLMPDQRDTVQAQCQSHCEHRGWRLWVANARSNHVHAVVTATGYSGATVRDQLKANCTRGLRERWEIFRARPVWTVGGDWQCINDVDELEIAIAYAGEAQDRKDRDAHQPEGASPRFESA